MTRTRITAAVVVLYTIAVVVVTVVWERRDRIDCTPGDTSCDDLNASHGPIFWAFGFLAWAIGTFLIVRLTRRFAKPS